MPTDKRTFCETFVHLQQQSRKRQRTIHHLSASTVPMVYTLSMLPPDMIQYICSFVQPIRQLEEHMTKTQTTTMRNLYGYLKDRPDRTLFLWPGALRLEHVNGKNLVLLTQIISFRDYNRVTIDCLSLSKRDVSLLDKRALQRAIPLFARTMRLDLVNEIPEWLIDYLSHFTGLQSMCINMIHTDKNIRRAYRLFTCTSFTTMVNLSLLQVSLFQPLRPYDEEDEKEDDETMGFVEEPSVIDATRCFLLPIPTAAMTNMIGSTAVQSVVPLSEEIDPVKCGLFGATVTAIAHNPHIRTLRLCGISIPMWDLSSIHGIVPWHHLQTLELEQAEDMNCALRAFFLLQLPQLQEYKEDDDVGSLWISDRLKSVLAQTSVSRISFFIGFDGPEEYILPDLTPIPAIKSLRWYHAQVYDLDEMHDAEPGPIWDDHDDWINSLKNNEIVKKDKKMLEKRIRNAVQRDQRTIEHLNIEMDTVGHAENVVVWKIELTMK